MRPGAKPKPGPEREPEPKQEPDPDTTHNASSWKCEASHVNMYECCHSFRRLVDKPRNLRSPDLLAPMPLIRPLSLLVCFKCPCTARGHDPHYGRCLCCGWIKTHSPSRRNINWAPATVYTEENRKTLTEMVLFKFYMSYEFFESLVLDSYS